MAILNRSPRIYRCGCLECVPARNRAEQRAEAILERISTPEQMRRYRTTRQQQDGDYLIDARSRAVVDTRTGAVYCLQFEGDAVEPPADWVVAVRLALASDTFHRSAWPHPVTRILPPGRTNRVIELNTVACRRSRTVVV